MNIYILAEEFYDYITVIRNNTEATKRRYKFTLNLFCRDTGISSTQDITQEKLLLFFYHGRKNRHWSSRTFLTYYVTLKGFFKWCVMKRILLENPIEHIEKPRLEKLLPKRLLKKDALRLLEIVYNYPYAKRDRNLIRSRNHAIMATFIFAGLRKKEVLNLKYSDVDLENQTLFVRQGKGNKDRFVPICYALAHSLKRYSIERNKLKKTCPEFFVSSNRNLGYTDNGLKHLIKLAREVSGGMHITPHKLRHTFATLMIEGGCDIYSLSKMMGHSDIKTTTIYLSTTTEHLKGQMKKHPLNDLQFSI